MGKEGEEKRKKRERRKEEKKETRASRPQPRQPCRLHPRAKLRFAFGLLVGRQQQDGGSEWREERNREEVGGESWKWKNGRRVEAGRMLAIKKRKEKCWDNGVGGGGWRCVRRRPAKPEGRDWLAGDCGTGMKRMAAGGVGWPAGAGSDEAGGRKVWGSVKK